MNKSILYLFFVLVFILCSGMQACEEEVYQEQQISVVNESNSIIHVFGRTDFSYDYHITPGLAFSYHELEKVNPGEEVQPFRLTVTYNGMEKDGLYKVIIFKESTMDKYTPKEIIEENIFDCRYKFTFDEIKAMDFKIVYTGE